MTTRARTAISAEKAEQMHRRIWRGICWTMLALQVLVLGFALVLCATGSLQHCDTESTVIVALDCLGIAVLTMMLQSGMQSKLIDQIEVTFALLIFIGSLYLGSDAISWLMDGEARFYGIKWVVDTSTYMYPILMSALFYRLLHVWLNIDKWRSRVMDILFGVTDIIALIVVAGNLFGNYFFYITADAVYHRADAYAISLVLPSLLLVMCVVLILVGRSKPSDKAVLMVYPLVPYIAILLNAYEITPSILCVFVFAALAFLYTNIFVRREKELADKDAELAQSKLDSMLLQINPHFIYNTLGSVASLCTDDPERAKEILYSFSGYLRNNFGEMTRQAIVPFQKEMAHLALYIDIEKMRFPDIQVETDYQVTDFELPSLSVQPLVENAITHGIMGRESGGTVIISTYEDERAYCVSVVDDGVGFEEETPQDGRRHIGIRNVRRRIEMLCGGTLEFHSVVGKGTAAVIRIPKNAGGGIRKNDRFMRR